MTPALYLKSAAFQKKLEQISLIAALCMAFSFCFSFALFNVGIVVLITCFFIRRILAGNRSLFDGLLDAALLSYYISALFSVTQSQYLGMSLQGLHKLLRYLLLFAAAREVITDRRSIKLMTVFFLLGGTLAAADALSQLLIGRDFILGKTPFLSMEDLIRIGGPFNNPNALAIYLCFFIPLAFLLGVSKAKYSRWILIPSLMMVVVIGFTYSRPAATALVLAGLLIVLVDRIYWLPLATLVLAGVGLLLAPPAVKMWLASLGSWQNFFYDISRHYHHLAAWNMIAHSPIFGVGINTFDVNYAKYKVAEDIITRWSAHQAYLQIWAEMGIFGLLSFLMIVFGIFRLTWKAHGACKDNELKQILLGYAGGALAFLVISFFESSLWQPRQTYFFWFFSGILCGISKWVMTHDARS